MFSFEIVSIGGNIRFLVRTPSHFRDFVEANVYAQYPEAEITEVEDYVEFIPEDYPNEQYDLFGAEIKLGKEDAYPIRTYKYFADDIEKGFIDPLANLLEVMSRMSAGEQMWVQLILRPAGEKWKKQGEKIVEKLIGKQVKKREPLLLKGIQAAVGVIEPSPAKAGEEKKAERGGELPSQVLYLSPGDREVVEAVENNIAKIGFEVKFRIMYIAKKDVFDNKKGVNPLLGSLKLYGTQNLNTLKPHSKYWTLMPYFKDQLVPRRQRKIVKRYKKRDIEGAKPFVFNVEEVATVYHYPYVSVKAPSLIRAEARKGIPPADLPLE
jgi:hypothetical protein